MKIMEKVGERIAGSRFVRDYCLVCGDPIRVVTVGGNCCNKCFPVGGRCAQLTARMSIKNEWSTDERGAAA